MLLNSRLRKISNLKRNSLKNIKEKNLNSRKKLKEKTQGFGKSVWSSYRKQVQFLSLHKMIVFILFLKYSYEPTKMNCIIVLWYSVMYTKTQKTKTFTARPPSIKTRWWICRLINVRGGGGLRRHLDLLLHFKTI